MRILVLCTGNSCRSQMAEGFLKKYLPEFEICSAGTEAAGKVNEKAIEVMNEIGIDISTHSSDSVEMYLDREWDYVITVCGGANESCPAFTGKVKNRVHVGFEDPYHATGTDDEIMNTYRTVRDQIKVAFGDFANKLNK